MLRSIVYLPLCFCAQPAAPRGSRLSHAHALPPLWCERKEEHFVTYAHPALTVVKDSRGLFQDAMPPKKEAKKKKKKDDAPVIDPVKVGLSRPEK